MSRESASPANAFVLFRIPWWANWLAAIALWFVFDVWGESLQNRQDSIDAAALFVLPFVSIFQVLLPGLLFFAGAIGLIRRLRNTNIAVPAWFQPDTEDTPDSDNDAAAGDWSQELITDLERRAFKKLCMTYFQIKGHRIAEPGDKAAEGIDFYLHSNAGGRTEDAKPLGIVQCRSWTPRNAGINVVRELNTVRTTAKVPLAILIVAGEVTSQARHLAEQTEVKIINGRKLLSLLKQLPAGQSEALLQDVTDDDFATPTCPNCEIKLVETGNPQTGEPFWSCPNFASCDYRLPRSRN